VKEITTDKTILNENSPLLQDFFKDISKCPTYSSEEQIKFAREALAGNLKSREKLINSNLRFVITCAKKYTGLGVPLIDLIQSGVKGLILSIDNYNPDKGYKFLSFAVWYIRREILKEIYNTGRTIRYPITYISNITKVKKAYDAFVKTYQKEPTDEELIRLANVTQRQYDSVVIDKSYCQSIDTPISEDGNTTLGDTLTASISPFSDTFTKETISRALKCLNPREYKVITEYYGLDDVEERPIKDIAEEMNLGNERVRQIRKLAVKKLEKRFGKTLKTLL
jgi:RNA polymerase sigma factor (sigma-70 family)